MNELILRIWIIILIDKIQERKKIFKSQQYIISLNKQFFLKKHYFEL